MIEDVERRIARLIAQVRHGIYPPAVVLDELRNADLFAPLESLPAHADAPLRMPSFTDEHNVKYLTLFTSVRRLELWAPPGSDYVRLAFGAVSQNWPANTCLVLNPGGELAMSFAPSEITQPPVHTALLTVRAYVREPSPEPVAARIRVRQLCALRGWVRAAYRAEVFLHGSGELPHLVIGLSLDDRVEGIPAFAREVAINCAEVGVAPVSIILLDGAENDRLPICKFMRQRTRAWYERASPDVVETAT